jgi:hypothetical protein
MVSCSQTLKFTIIGADSTIFDKPVHNVTSVNVASAERIELLLGVDLKIGRKSENEIPKQYKTLYLTISDEIYARFELIDSIGEGQRFRKLPNEFNTINHTKFFDLTKIN